MGNKHSKKYEKEKEKEPARKTQVSRPIVAAAATERRRLTPREDFKEAGAVGRQTRSTSLATESPTLSDAVGGRTRPTYTSTEYPTQTDARKPSLNLPLGARPKSHGTVGRQTRSTYTEKGSPTQSSAVAGRTKPNHSLTESATQSGSNKAFETTVIKSLKNNAIICAAIDFGTTYSGYAYSFRAKPQTVLTNYWDGIHIKTPTVVLMSPRKEFHSFGQEARTHYMQKMKTNEHVDWFMFDRFKMKLFVQNGQLDKDMLLEDYTGKTMPAIDVIAAAITFMKEHLMKVLNDGRTTNGETQERVEIQNENDIHWVLTVPAIWNDLSKVFMRQAANKAGIPNHMLTLALEPEAASLFCKTDLGEQKSYVGCRYMVLDLGGGTADITSHEVNRDGMLKELHEPTGGAFGGTSVDNKFIGVLNSIFGAEIVNEFKKIHALDYWELVNDFEIKKRQYDGSGRMVMKFDTKILELYEANIGQDVMESIENSSVKGKIEFKQGKIFIETKLANTIFDEAVLPIREATEALYNLVGEINFIILVGGFSESPYIQKVMKENFQNLNIVIPSDPSGAVVKGAVIYGHETKAIASRVCKFTYGIARTENFKDHIHPNDKKFFVGGKAMCDDIFNKHIEIGEQVNVDANNEVKAHEYFPSVAHMKQAVLEVYASKKKNPKFTTDDGCQFVGLIKADIDPQGDIWSKILVKLIFGGTELIVEVKDMKNGKVTQESVDFIG